MKRYLLDTCALTWYLDDHKRAKDIAENIEYFQGDFAVSGEAIKELVYLVQSGKLKFSFDFDFDGFMALLNEKNIDIIYFDNACLKVLFSLPFYKNHPDPTDRHIIASAIAKNRILVSGDAKFGVYTKNGLLCLEI